MVYQGSKNKLSKHLKPIIEQFLKPGMNYIEPFVGGANMIDKIEWPNKYGYDINPYLIELLEHFQEHDVEFIDLSKDEWTELRERYKEGEIHWLIGYAGFICSFNSRFFQGYGSLVNNRNLNFERHKNLYKQSQSEQFKNIHFKCLDFKLLKPTNSVIYLDPPYKGTTKYKGTKDFDYDALWAKCKEWHNDGNIVLMSELDAPNDDFKCIWAKDYKYKIGTQKCKKAIERLYIYMPEEQ